MLVPAGVLGTGPNVAVALGRRRRPAFVRHAGAEGRRPGKGVAAREGVAATTL
ncbi:hypothetical protein AB0O28_34755 [Microbispora sp. NPDC088329]|uniref:hypothetical protein n=1 Tax=Microbispora sp. NPDC088329 TaxID=3154869 RepID=UPI003432B89B